MHSKEERIAIAKASREEQEVRNAVLEEFWAACDAGDLDRIRELYETTPFIRTVAYIYVTSESVLNSPEVIHCLFELGVDPRVTYDLAKECYTLKTFKIFAEFGLDFKAEGHEILEYTVDKREILDWLLDQGVDINSYSSFRPVKKGDRDDTVGVLNEAAALGDTTLFDYLVGRGAEPKRSIAVHHATRCKDPAKTVAMIAHLIEKYHFDVNADDSCGGLRDFCGDPPMTPLDEACSNRNAAAVEALLKHGAEPGDGPLSSAVHCNTISEIRFHLDAGADPTRGCNYAVRGNKLESAKICLEYGADVDDVEAEDKEWVTDPTCKYDGMSNEMQKLLYEWKSKTRQGAMNDGGKDLAQKPGIDHDADKTT